MSFFSVPVNVFFHKLRLVNYFFIHCIEIIQFFFEYNIYLHAYNETGNLVGFFKLQNWEKSEIGSHGNVLTQE